MISKELLISENACVPGIERFMRVAGGNPVTISTLLAHPLIHNSDITWVFKLYNISRRISGRINDSDILELLEYTIDLLDKIHIPGKVRRVASCKNLITSSPSVRRAYLYTVVVGVLRDILLDYNFQEHHDDIIYHVDKLIR